jgi:hypothetical protein
VIGGNPTASRRTSKRPQGAARPADIEGPVKWLIAAFLQQASQKASP